MKLIRLRPWSYHHFSIAWFNIKKIILLILIIFKINSNNICVNGLQKYTKLSDGNIAIQESIENSLLTVHDISTENVGALCMEKVFRPLEIPINSERYESARQKVDLAASVLNEVGVNTQNGLMEALAKGILSDEYVKSSRILAINISNGALTKSVWLMRTNKIATVANNNNITETIEEHQEDGLEIDKKPDPNYPWFDDELPSSTVLSPKFVPTSNTVKFKGWWTFPYFSCIDRKWILSYSVKVSAAHPHLLRGLISIDIDINNLRVNQCEKQIITQQQYYSLKNLGYLNKFHLDNDLIESISKKADVNNEEVQAFHGSHKCHHNSMMCEYRNLILNHGIDIQVKKLLPASIAQSSGQQTTSSSIIPLQQQTFINNILNGWSRGSYQCLCKHGYYSERFPTGINGTIMEVAYQEYQDNISIFYMEQFKCLPCAPGCGFCLSPAPCLASYNWPFRISLLIISVCCAISTILLAGYMFHHRKKKIFKVASPIFLSITLIGCAIMYMEMAAIFPILDTYWCIATKWSRHMGFCITYTSLLMKTWRVSLTYRVKSAHKVKLTDKQLLQWMVPILLVMLIYLGTWTLSAAPNAEIIRDQDGLKFKQCSYNWWDHSLAIGEVFFLAWGVRVCYNVRNAESLYNEARQISYAIYNIALVNITMVAFHLLIFPQAGPDIKYLLGFIRTQLSTSVTIALVFGPKVLRVLRGQGDQWDNKAKVRSITASFSLNGVGLVAEDSPDLYQENEELKEEIQKLAHQIEFMKTVHMQMNNRHLKPKPGSYFTITSTSFQTPLSSNTAAAAAAATTQTSKGVPVQTQTSCKTSQPTSCISDDAHSGSNSIGANSIGFATTTNIPVQNNGFSDKV